jgi:hypothetical protein
MNGRAAALGLRLSTMPPQQDAAFPSVADKVLHPAGIAERTPVSGTAV